MYNLDKAKFVNEIKIFLSTIAPTDKQWNYLNGCKGQIGKEIRDTAAKSGHSIERCLLTAICGELNNCSSKQEQAEFAARLILLDLLME